MIRQQFDVEHYYRVIVWYSLDYNLFHYVYRDLMLYGFSEEFVIKVYNNLTSGKAKAVTCSNIYNKVSLVIFNKHDDWLDYLDSLVHEAEHVKQAMLRAYMVEDAGEPPAYTIGYLIKRMWEVFKDVS